MQRIVRPFLGTSVSVGGGSYLCQAIALNQRLTPVSSMQEVEPETFASYPWWRPEKTSGVWGRHVKYTYRIGDNSGPTPLYDQWIVMEQVSGSFPQDELGLGGDDPTLLGLSTTAGGTFTDLVTLQIPSQPAGITYDQRRVRRDDPAFPNGGVNQTAVDCDGGGWWLGGAGGGDELDTVYFIGELTRVDPDLDIDLWQLATADDYTAVSVTVGTQVIGVRSGATGKFLHWLDPDSTDSVTGCTPGVVLYDVANSPVSKWGFIPGEQLQFPDDIAGGPFYLGNPHYMAQH